MADPRRQHRTFLAAEQRGRRETPKAAIGWCGTGVEARVGAYFKITGWNVGGV